MDTNDGSSVVDHEEIAFNVKQDTVSSNSNPVSSATVETGASITNSDQDFTTGTDSTSSSKSSPLNCDNHNNSPSLNSSTQMPFPQSDSASPTKTSDNHQNEASTPSSDSANLKPLPVMEENTVNQAPPLKQNLMKPKTKWRSIAISASCSTSSDGVKSPEKSNITDINSTYSKTNSTSIQAAAATDAMDLKVASNGDSNTELQSSSSDNVNTAVISAEQYQAISAAISNCIAAESNDAGVIDKNKMNSSSTSPSLEMETQLVENMRIEGSPTSIATATNNTRSTASSSSKAAPVGDVTHNSISRGSIEATATISSESKVCIDESGLRFNFLSQLQKLDTKKTFF